MDGSTLGPTDGALQSDILLVFLHVGFSVLFSALVGGLTALCTCSQRKWHCGIGTFERALKAKGVRFEVYQQLRALGVRSRTTLANINEEKWDKLTQHILDFEQVDHIEQLRDHFRSIQDHGNLLEGIEGYHKLEEDDSWDSHQRWKSGKRTFVVFTTVTYLLIIGVAQMREANQRKGYDGELQREMAALNAMNSKRMAALQEKLNATRVRGELDREIEALQAKDRMLEGLLHRVREQGTASAGGAAACRWCHSCGGAYHKWMAARTPTFRIRLHELGPACAGEAPDAGMASLCCA